MLKPVELASASTPPGIWFAVATGLSQLFGRVTGCSVQADELVHERLAISGARTGSLVGSIHGRPFASRRCSRATPPPPRAPALGPS
jgi:hypothetical protein